MELQDKDSGGKKKKGKDEKGKGKYVQKQRESAGQTSVKKNNTPDGVLNLAVLYMRR